MVQTLIQTGPDYIYLFLRIVAGVIIFPYGMQKLFGWFNDLGGGVGIEETTIRLREKKIPLLIISLIIVGQSAGSVALILGFFSRIAAAGNFIIFTGALLSHASDGWAMNWSGKKKGEGIEYFVMLLSILTVIIIRGGGPLSIDFWLFSRMKH
jgi:putative oxidoreductase